MPVNCESFCKGEGLFISDCSERDDGVWVFSAVAIMRIRALYAGLCTLIMNQHTHSLIQTWQTKRMKVL